MTANKPETWTREYLLGLWKLQVKEIDRVSAVAAERMVKTTELRAALNALVGSVRRYDERPDSAVARAALDAAIKEAEDVLIR